MPSQSKQAMSLIEHRLKLVGQTGGIMSTLRSASNAARGALPTLTLVRRQDLVFAQASGYLQSMEGFPSMIQGDLNNALQLGQVNNALFGVPYLLDLQHVVYRPIEDVDYSEWTFDAVLERGEALAFPASRSSSLNDVLALQYLESYGNRPNGNPMILDAVALSTVYEFYEAARDNQLITDEFLEYTNPNGYAVDFLDGSINAGVFTSTRYLRMFDEDDTLAMATIPSETGNPISLMNGWMWVMVTSDAEEQAIALDYLNWMFDAERQSTFAADILMLPSRETSIELGLANDIPSAPYLALIDNAILPLTDSEIGLVGREIQNQFVTMLTSEVSAENAVAAVINVVGE